jgi:hypothetical protein
MTTRADVETGDAAMLDELRSWEWRERLEPAPSAGSLRRVSWGRSTVLCTSKSMHGQVRLWMLR